MRRHVNKSIAPVIVAICLIGYYIVGAITLAKLDVSNIIKSIAIAISVIITVVTVMVLVERINEIKRGEEDDLSKY
jgi:hypothetical protein